MAAARFRSPCSRSTRGRPELPSTVISGFDYRPETGELEVLFTTGRRYVYQGVPPEAAAAFRAARIKGRHFNRRIRGRYPFTELDGIPADRGS